MYYIKFTLKLNWSMGINLNRGKGLVDTWISRSCEPKRVSSWGSAKAARGDWTKGVLQDKHYLHKGKRKWGRNLLFLSPVNQNGCISSKGYWSKRSDNREWHKKVMQEDIHVFGKSMMPSVVKTCLHKEKGKRGRNSFSNVQSTYCGQSQRMSYHTPLLAYVLKNEVE